MSDSETQISSNPIHEIKQNQNTTAISESF